MMIHEITVHVGRHKRRKRVGRGPGSGTGKTAGRGSNGARSRSGFSTQVGREGGQMPLYRRVPKRGFSNTRFRGPAFAIVNIRALDARFEDHAEVTPETLVAAGLVGSTRQPVKVLGAGETKKKLKVTAAAFSQTAQDKITQAGGSVTVADYKKKAAASK
ncbi:MAG: 50S ribosomal protein L15 [Phycisphaeraceae bacterium]